MQACAYDDERGDGLVDPPVLLEEVAGDEAQAQHRREHADGHHRGAAPRRPAHRRQRLPPRRRRHRFYLPASRPCPLLASLLLLPPRDGGFWRVAGGGLGNGGARHGGTRGRVEGPCLRGAGSQETRVCEESCRR